MFRRFLMLLAILLLGIPARPGAPPTFVGPFPDHSLEVAQNVRHPVPRAVDAVGGGATVTVSGLPRGLVFEPWASVISGATAQVGTFRVELKATDRKGKATRLSASYQVNESGTARLMATALLSSNARITLPVPPVNVVAGTVLSFQGTADGGGNATWNFGDGSSKIGFTASHPFAAAGTYTVTFTVKASRDYAASSASLQVAVVSGGTPPGIASFVASPDTIGVGGSSTLSWSVGGATSLRLDQGIGAVTGTTSRTVAPSATTTYKLTATNAAGSSSATCTVNVSSGPVISIDQGPSATVGLGQGLVLSATVIGGGNSGVIWSGPQGIGSFSSTSANPTVWTAPSTTAGTYVLTASDPVGFAATDSISVTVPIKVVISPGIDSGPPGDPRTFGASVLGTTSTAVTWTASGGSPLSGTGNSFTWASPQGAAVGAVFTLTATSVADPTRKATVTYTVIGGTVTGVAVNPGTATLGVGTTQAFTAMVSGTGAFNTAVTWSVVEPSGGSVDAYGLYTAPANLGTYHIQATSNQDPTKTGRATVTVNASGVAPSITVQPQPQTVTAGQTATYSVTAAGTAPLTYQWRRNGSNVGSNAATYTTPATIQGDSGAVYSVVVSNAYGSATSSGAALTVNAAGVAPSITVQPQPQTVTAGQTATFSVTAAGTAPLSYQWRRNGSNVGTSAASYTTPATTVADSGAVYTVVVSNAHGSVTSTGAALTVNAAGVAPSITVQPQPQTVTAGQTATFSVSAAGTAPLSFQWRRNGSNVGTSAASYTTPATTVADSGAVYSVVVSNAHGSVTSTGAALTVNAAGVAPSITVQPQPQTVTAGQTATFSVSAAGTAPLSFQWRRNGSNVGTSAASYTTPATTVADSGTVYSVVVSNTYGSVTSSGAVLTVNVAAPSISYVPAIKVFQVGTAIGTWSPSNSGGAAASWSINPALPAGLVFNGSDGSISGTPSAARARGDYTVTASNAAGGATAVIQVTVAGVLGPMTWKRDVVYLGGREVGEVDASGVRVTLTDHLGSPRLLVDPGGTVSEQKFMPFGESLTDTTTMGKSAKGFTGHEQTDPSGLIYMQARFYAPMYHRFLSPDPGRDQHFENTQSWNIYSYVTNNPICRVDPTGMWADTEPSQVHLNGMKIRDGQIKDRISGSGGRTSTGLDDRAQSAEPIWNDNLVLVVDEKYRDKNPAFIARQIEALKSIASSIGHNVSITMHYIKGLNDRLASPNGAEASEKVSLAFMNEMVSIGKSNNTNLVASILPPIPWSRINGGMEGEGFTQRHNDTGINVIFSANNSRALAHEFLHTAGYSRGKWSNTQPFNYFHNRKFEKMMDAAGVPPSSYPKDY